jgi:hypothetical protein
MLKFGNFSPVWRTATIKMLYEDKEPHNLPDGHRPTMQCFQSITEVNLSQDISQTESTNFEQKIQIRVMVLLNYDNKKGCWLDTRGSEQAQRML